MISAGRLRFQASVRREANTDNTGKREKDFSSVIGSFRCDLRDAGASEVEYGGGPATARQWECRARWGAISALGLLASDRLVIDSMTFQIVGISNEANRDRLAIINLVEIIL